MSTTNKPKLYLSEVKRDIDNGMKKDELCTKYGLNKNQMTQLLKAYNFKIRRTRAPQFEVVNDLPKGESILQTLELNDAYQDLSPDRFGEAVSRLSSTSVREILVSELTARVSDADFEAINGVATPTPIDTPVTNAPNF